MTCNIISISHLFFAQHAFPNKKSHSFFYLNNYFPVCSPFPGFANKTSEKCGPGFESCKLSIMAWNKYFHEIFPSFQRRFFSFASKKPHFPWESNLPVGKQRKPLRLSNWSEVELHPTRDEKGKRFNYLRARLTDTPCIWLRFTTLDVRCLERLSRALSAGQNLLITCKIWWFNHNSRGS